MGGLPIEGNAAGAIARAALDDAIDELIATRDLLDGDPDMEPDDEPNDDETDGTFAEDECAAFDTRVLAPGCPIADPGGCEHDGREVDDGL